MNEETKTITSRFCWFLWNIYVYTIVHTLANYVAHISYKLQYVYKQDGTCTVSILELWMLTISIIMNTCQYVDAMQ